MGVFIAYLIILKACSWSEKLDAHPRREPSQWDSQLQTLAGVPSLCLKLGTLSTRLDDHQPAVHLPPLDTSYSLSNRPVNCSFKTENTSVTGHSLAPYRSKVTNDFERCHLAEYDELSGVNELCLNSNKGAMSSGSVDLKRLLRRKA